MANDQQKGQQRGRVENSWWSKGRGGTTSRV